MCLELKVLKAFIEEVRDGLFVALQGKILCLWSGMEIVRRMMDANEIKEGFTSQSVLTLDDPTLVLHQL